MELNEDANSCSALPCDDSEKSMSLRVPECSSHQMLPASSLATYWSSTVAFLQVASTSKSRQNLDCARYRKLHHAFRAHSNLMLTHSRSPQARAWEQESE